MKVLNATILFGTRFKKGFFCCHIGSDNCPHKWSANSTCRPAKRNNMHYPCFSFVKCRFKRMLVIEKIQRWLTVCNIFLYVIFYPIHWLFNLQMNIVVLKRILHWFDCSFNQFHFKWTQLHLIYLNWTRDRSRKFFSQGFAINIIPHTTQTLSFYHLFSKKYLITIS